MVSPDWIVGQLAWLIQICGCVLKERDGRFSTELAAATAAVNWASMKQIDVHLVSTYAIIAR